MQSSCIFLWLIHEMIFPDPAQIGWKLDASVVIFIEKLLNALSGSAALVTMFIASVGMNFAIFVELVGRTRRQLVDADFGMNHILSAVRMAGSREWHRWRPSLQVLCAFNHLVHLFLPHVLAQTLDEDGADLRTFDFQLLACWNVSMILA